MPWARSGGRPTEAQAVSRLSGRSSGRGALIGAADFLQVLDAERRLLEAQDGLSAGRTDAATALVAVFRALGGVWPEEE